MLAIELRSLDRWKRLLDACDRTKFAMKHSVKPAASRGFRLGARLTWPADIRPYRRAADDPPFRRLRIFAVDPAVSRFEGCVTEAHVPFEPLLPGPIGAVIEVVDRDDSAQRTYAPVDLEARNLLIQSGVAPSSTEPKSHQQMVYAVAARLYATFQTALGRDPSWGFPGKTLRLRPHAFNEDNAYYDRENGEVAFGYFQSAGSDGSRQHAREWIFTCLSHDVVAHELSHAFLDGMRPGFALSTSKDVDGFHEGFSDVVAIFHRLTHRGVLREAVAGVRGDLSRESVLSRVAAQFGTAVGAGNALRHAVEAAGDSDTPIKQYSKALDAHDLGELLLGSVFEAFTRIVQRRVQSFMRLGSGGTGVYPEGQLPHELIELVTDEAARVATQFLNICIRAIDYCPPVNIELGEYVRALITADHDLVPDDPWGYRESIIAAFRRRAIYPRHVPTLSEEALLWRPFRLPERMIRGLSFGDLWFNGEPGRPAGEAELIRQGEVLGAYISDGRLAAFGLEKPGRSKEGHLVDRPTIESIRSLRRVGPQGTVAFDLVAEVVQSVEVRRPGRKTAVTLYGGVTIILGAEGEIRYTIGKRALQPARMNEQLEFLAGHSGPVRHRCRRISFRPAAS